MTFQVRCLLSGIKVPQFDNRIGEARRRGQHLSVVRNRDAHRELFSHVQSAFLAARSHVHHNDLTSGAAIGKDLGSIGKREQVSHTPPAAFYRDLEQLSARWDVPKKDARIALWIRLTQTPRGET